MYFLTTDGVDLCETSKYFITSKAKVEFWNSNVSSVNLATGIMMLGCMPVM